MREYPDLPDYSHIPSSVVAEAKSSKDYLAWTSELNAQHEQRIAVLEEQAKDAQAAYYSDVAAVIHDKCDDNQIERYEHGLLPQHEIDA